MTRSYVISVSLGKGCYRHIQISASATLYQLHQVILAAFDMEDDHAHAFFLDNRTWSSYEAYFSMKMRGNERLTTEHTLKKCGLAKDHKFKYLFDFGDELCFQCKILRELEERTDIPGVIRSIGDAPWQREDPFGQDDKDSCFPKIYDRKQAEALYKALPLPEKTVRTVRQYAAAASRLYGIIPLWVVLKIYNQQNPPLSEEDFTQIAEVMRHEANDDFVILGAEALYCGAPTVSPLEREIISVPVMECGPDTYDDLAEQQQGKAYAVFPKEEFLKYANPEYIPITPENENMLGFLKKRECRSVLPPLETLSILQTLLWLDAPFGEILDGLQENSFRFKNQKEIDEFLSLLNEMDFTTRKIAHRGQTLEELTGQMAQRAKKPAAQLKRAMPSRKEPQKKAPKKAPEKPSVPQESSPEQASLFGEEND